MAIGRRDFIGGIGALSFTGSAYRLFGDEKPLLRIGVMTDTHIGRTKASCGRVTLAYQLFRRLGADLMVTVGDVADFHYPTGYRAYRETVEEVFAGVAAADRPRELFVYAAHDYFNYGGRKKRSLWSRDATPAFADMQRLIGAGNGPYAHGAVKGFPYVVFPQSMTEGLDLKRCDRMIADAVAANPGKPVFVFAHIPPGGTTRGGGGSRAKREMLNKYPQVVNISGHTHGSLADERSIWQGEFTSVNAGCLQNWGGGLAGNNVPRNQNYGVVIIDVFPARIVFRRFDVRDGEESNDPWMIPWPFDPAAAPYRAAGRKEKSAAPSFAAGAVLKVEPWGDEGGVSLTVPVAGGVTRPFTYRVFLEYLDGNRKWRSRGRRDFFGDAWQRPHERPEKYELEVPGPYFDPGRRYRFRVFPLNCFAKAGSPIAVEFTAPEFRSKKKPQVIWESNDPMKDCPFLAGLSGKKSMPMKDGFYEMGEGSARLVFPDGVWKGEKDARFRFVADVHTVQGEHRSWNINLRNPNPLKNAHGRIPTPRGDSGSLRYVIDFAKADEDHCYYLLVREGGGGKIRFDYARIERIQN